MWFRSGTPEEKTCTYFWDAKTLLTGPAECTQTILCLGTTDPGATPSVPLLCLKLDLKGLLAQTSCYFFLTCTTWDQIRPARTGGMLQIQESREQDSRWLIVRSSEYNFHRQRESDQNLTEVMQACLHLSIILVLGKLKQWNASSEAHLGFMLTPCLGTTRRNHLGQPFWEWWRTASFCFWSQQAKAYRKIQVLERRGGKTCLPGRND